MARRIEVKLESQDSEGVAALEISLDTGKTWKRIAAAPWLNQTAGTWALLPGEDGIRLDTATEPGMGRLSSLKPGVAAVGATGKGGANDATFKWTVTKVTN